MVEESFEYLDAPVERIAGADIPMPYAANLERLALPQVIHKIDIYDRVSGGMTACYKCFTDMQIEIVRK